MRALLALLLIVGLALGGCASTSTTKTHGDSSASMRTGSTITTETATTTAPNGEVTVTVTETCEGCNEEKSVGGKGGEDFYKTLAQVFSAFIGIASIVVQVLK